MKAGEIIESIRKALGCEFDRELAIRRLHAATSKLPGIKLQIKKERGNFRYYEVRNRQSRYLSRSSSRLYVLARKRYCSELVKLLKCESDMREHQLNKIHALLYKFECSELDMARIVFMQRQYEWYKKNFVRKPQGDAPHKLEDYFVRSKSEQKIGRRLLSYAAPFHFEEQLVINVQHLVKQLEKTLEEGIFYNWEYNGKLFFIKDGTTIWIVPPELRWMNASGSPWKTYDPRSGTITIYPDFKLILADGTIKVWEHEGLAEDFFYRCNANERVSLMVLTGTVAVENIIETYEFDVDDDERLERIIEREILPGLWW